MSPISTASTIWVHPVLRGTAADKKEKCNGCLKRDEDIKKLEEKLASIHTVVSGWNLKSTQSSTSRIIGAIRNLVEDSNN